MRKRQDVALATSTTPERGTGRTNHAERTSETSPIYTTYPHYNKKWGPNLCSLPYLQPCKYCSEWDLVPPNPSQEKPSRKHKQPLKAIMYDLNGAQ